MPLAVDCLEPVLTVLVVVHWRVVFRWRAQLEQETDLRKKRFASDLLEPVLDEVRPDLFESFRLNILNADLLALKHVFPRCGVRRRTYFEIGPRSIIKNGLR